LVAKTLLRKLSPELPSIEYPVENLEEYAKYVEKTDSPAGPVELLAFAQNYEVEFLVFDINKKTLIPTVYPAHCDYKARVYLLTDSKTNYYELIIGLKKKGMKHDEEIAIFSYDDTTAYKQVLLAIEYRQENRDF